VRRAAFSSNFLLTGYLKLGAFYEAGNICAAFYSAEALPEAATLVQDLQECLDLYRILADKDVGLTEPVEMPAGGELIEDLTRFRWHRRIDRDARAVQRVKKTKGYTCEICSFNFESRYGEIGKGFIENSDDAIISKDLNGVITSWNEGAVRIFGYSAEEMIGTSIRRMIPPDRQNEVDEILADLRRGERRNHFETVRTTKDGRRIFVSLTISPIKDETGQVIGASKIAREVTDRKLVEADLLGRESQAENKRSLDKICWKRPEQVSNGLDFSIPPMSSVNCSWLKRSLPFSSPWPGQLNSLAPAAWCRSKFLSRPRPKSARMCLEGNLGVPRHPLPRACAVLSGFPGCFCAC
jgi:PAS domain S-box-containing protein